MTETKRPESRSYCKGECGRRHPSRMDREMSAAKDARSHGGTSRNRTTALSWRGVRDDRYSTVPSDRTTLTDDAGT